MQTHSPAGRDMLLDVPELYFRFKDSGATVYRVTVSSKMARLEFVKIASAALKSGNINTFGDAVLTEAETARIRDWIEEQRAGRPRNLASDMRRLSREINLATHQMAAGTGHEEELGAEITRLLLSLMDMQREIAEKIVGKRSV